MYDDDDDDGTVAEGTGASPMLKYPSSIPQPLLFLILLAPARPAGVPGLTPFLVDITDNTTENHQRSLDEPPETPPHSRRRPHEWPSHVSQLRPRRTAKAMLMQPVDPLPDPAEQASWVPSSPPNPPTLALTGDALTLVPEQLEFGLRGLPTTHVGGVAGRHELKGAGPRAPTFPSAAPLGSSHHPG